jgi:hypothetical protein
MKFWSSLLNGSRKIRPSEAYYWLVVPVFFIGTGFFLYTLVHGLMHVTDSLTQVVVPGSAELTFRKGRTYTVFLEERSVVGGQIYATNDPVDGLRCRVKELANGSRVDLRPPKGSTTYNFRSRSGRSVLEFLIPEDGAYDFACDYQNGSPGPSVVVAVGAGVGEKIVGTILKCFLAMGVTAIAAGAIFLTIFLLRERSRKEYGVPPVAGH